MQILESIATVYVVGLLIVFVLFILADWRIMFKSCEDQSHVSKAWFTATLWPYLLAITAYRRMQR